MGSSNKGSPFKRQLEEENHNMYMNRCLGVPEACKTVHRSAAVLMVMLVGLLATAGAASAHVTMRLDPFGKAERRGMDILVSQLPCGTVLLPTGRMDRAAMAVIVKMAGGDLFLLGFVVAYIRRKKRLRALSLFYYSLTGLESSVETELREIAPR